MTISIRLIKALGLLALLSGGLTGCASYYQLTSEYVSQDTAPEPPKVLETKEYKKEKNSIKVVAVQAPDACTRSKGRGKTKAKRNIIAQQCGVSLADIERGLVMAGYEVVSWKEFQAAQAGGRTPREAAVALKTDAIFLINTLDLTSVQMGLNARYERRFFKSDEQGNNKGKALVDDQLKSVFVKKLRPKESLLSKVERLSATVNATMVMSKTGRSVWFYEWSVAEEKRNNLKTSVHLKCDGIICDKPSNDQSSNFFSKNLSSGDTEAVSTQQRTFDQKKAVWDKLMKKVITDLLNRFSTGSGN